MLARLNYVLRALWSAARRRGPREPLDLLSAEAVQARMLRMRRAVGVAAVVGAAGWVMLGGPMHAGPQAVPAGWGDGSNPGDALKRWGPAARAPHPTWRVPPSSCRQGRRPPLVV